MPPISSRVVVVAVEAEEGEEGEAEEEAKEEDASSDVGSRSRHGSAVCIIRSVDAAAVLISFDATWSAKKKKKKEKGKERRKKEEEKHSLSLFGSTRIVLSLFPLAEAPSSSSSLPSIFVVGEGATAAAAATGF